MILLVLHIILAIYTFVLSITSDSVVMWGIAHVCWMIQIILDVLKLKGIGVQEVGESKMEKNKDCWNCRHRDKDYSKYPCYKCLLIAKYGGEMNKKWKSRTILQKLLDRTKQRR